MDAAFWFESLGNPKIRLPISKRINCLGRAVTSDIVVRHETVSRKHAEIIVEDGKVRVIDLNSRNGTYLGDERVADVTMRPNQIIRFGDVALLLVSADEGEGDEETASKPTQPPPLPQDDSAMITRAQTRVLDLLKDGLSEKQIAHRLRLSKHTVHNHIKRIHEIYDVHSRAELLAHIFATKKQPPNA